MTFFANSGPIYFYVHFSNLASPDLLDLVARLAGIIHLTQDEGRNQAVQSEVAGEDLDEDVPTKRASPLLVGWPPASPVKPIFFHEAAMADWAPTARVPESAAMPMERPEAREERPQQRPAARWAKPLYWLYPAKPVPLSGFTILPFRITVTLRMR